LRGIVPDPGIESGKIFRKISEISIQRESQTGLRYYRYKTLSINLSLLNELQNPYCLQTLTPGSDSDNIYERKRGIVTSVNTFYQG